MKRFFIENIQEIFILSDKLQLHMMKDQQIGENELLEIYKNPEVFKYYSNKPYITDKRSLKIYIINQLNLIKKNALLIWNILYEKKVIGQIQLFDFDNCYTCAQISYFLHPDYWNKNINTLVVSTISEYAIIYMGLERIEAYIYWKNIASYKSLEKSGYQREGLLRNKYQIEGQVDNCYIYSRIRN